MHFPIVEQSLYRFFSPAFAFFFQYEIYFLHNQLIHHLPILRIRSYFHGHSFAVQLCVRKQLLKRFFVWIGEEEVGECSIKTVSVSPDESIVWEGVLKLADDRFDLVSRV